MNIIFSPWSCHVTELKFGHCAKINGKEKSFPVFQLVSFHNEQHDSQKLCALFQRFFTRLCHQSQSVINFMCIEVLAVFKSAFILLKTSSDYKSTDFTVFFVVVVLAQSLNLILGYSMCWLNIFSLCPSGFLSLNRLLIHHGLDQNKSLIEDEWMKVWKYCLMVSLVTSALDHILMYLWST